MASNGNGGMNDPPVFSTQYEVELPAGGALYLQTPEEVDLWANSSERYREDYHLSKTNDLVLLGAILQQQIELFRAQRMLNGLKPEMDAGGQPTGKYIQAALDDDDRDRIMSRLNKASGEIRTLEKALGIDKLTREAGGAVSVENYLRTLKSAAHERGIHVTQRTLEYERVVNEARWRLRMLANCDPEDRAYHDITPDKILEWLKGELDTLEEVDKKFDRERGKLYVGKL
jgi:hypothetical protein